MKDWFGLARGILECELTPSEQVEQQLVLLEKFAEELREARGLPKSPKLTLGDAREMGGYDPGDLDGAGSWSGGPGRFSK